MVVVLLGSLRAFKGLLASIRGYNKWKTYKFLSDECVLTLLWMADIMFQWDELIDT